MSDFIENRDEAGFTLIELLIAIVVVGILAAVAIVGIAGLTDTGNKSACKNSQDGAKAAGAAFYANSINAAAPDTTPWPQNFTELTAGGATAVFEKPAGADITTDVKKMKVGEWTLAMTSDGTAAPTYVCTP